MQHFLVEISLIIVGGGWLVAAVLCWEVLQKLKEAMMTLDDVKAKVTAERTVIDSAVLLLTQLADLVRANATDPAKIQEIADSIDANAAALASAVTANTPQTPPPPPNP